MFCVHVNDTVLTVEGYGPLIGYGKTPESAKSGAIAAVREMAEAILEDTRA